MHERRAPAAGDSVDGPPRSDGERRSAAAPAAGQPDSILCPSCGHPMHAVRGSRHAICANCGFKDACCY